MARIEDSAEGWRRVWMADNWTPQVDPEATAFSASIASGSTEVYHYRLYRSLLQQTYGFNYLTKGLVPGADAGANQAIWRARINDITPWLYDPEIMGGISIAGPDFDTNGYSSSRGFDFVYRNMGDVVDASVAAGVTDRYQEPQIWLDNNPTAGVFNNPSNPTSYYGQVLRRPIEVYFYKSTGGNKQTNVEPEWAIGCTATVQGGAWYSYLPTIPCKVDILSQNGVTFKTFDLHFYDGSGPPPLTTTQGSFGEFTTVFEDMPANDSGYTRLLGESASGALYSGNGGAVTFTYTGRCGGFRIREGQPWDMAYRWPNDANHIGISLSMWGKQTVPYIPPLRWNQRNDGNGLTEQSNRITLGTGPSSVGFSNRLESGNNTYE